MRHLLPTECWALLQADTTALLIDIRMEIESMFVGAPPAAVNIPWYEYPDFTPDPDAFCAAVHAEASGNKTRPILLLCRSGQRSVHAGNALEGGGTDSASDAGAALEHAGFTNVINVLHGFEGDLDENFHRSTLNGWRFDGLPWQQM
jgi:rhodanese-related sulfurtransferase